MVGPPLAECARARPTGPIGSRAALSNATHAARGPVATEEKLLAIRRKGRGPTVSGVSAGYKLGPGAAL